MAGVKKGSSDNLTSPIPHLLNADFLTAVARLTAGQVHYPGRDYYQRDTDTHYRLQGLAKCFLADGTTPATQAGTWGTLEAHWLPADSLTLNQTAAIAAAQALLSTDGNLITGLTATQTAQGTNIATNTQNITANTVAIAANTAALPGKFTNRGTFAPNTAYATNDVIVQAGNAYFRQLVAFTPTAFVAGDWVAYSTPQFTSAQVATVLARASAVSVLTTSGSVGYDTLDAALAATGRTQPISAILNAATFTIATTNIGQFTEWPAYFDGRGASITVNDGITLTVSGGDNNSCIITNAFFLGQTAGTGVVVIPFAGHQGNPAALAVQVIGCYSAIPVQLTGSAAVTFVNGYYKSLTGTGTVYLYGTVQVDSIASTLTVVDRRPGATAAGATGPAGPTGATATGGVFRGAFAAVAYAQYDCIIIPSGQANAGLFAYATTAFTATATYAPANWTLDPGQSTNDYTSAEKTKLAGLSTSSSDTYADLAYAASIALDFNAATVRTLALAGNVTFTTSANVALLKTKELYLINSTAATIILSFPAGWSFFPGPAPASLPAGKQAVLTLRCLGADDTTVKAAFVAQA